MLSWPPTFSSRLPVTVAEPEAALSAIGVGPDGFAGADRRRARAGRSRPVSSSWPAVVHDVGVGVLAGDVLRRDSDDFVFLRSAIRHRRWRRGR